MRVHLVDPPAFTPPYDRSLAAALARAGADVTLVTSRFDYGEVPPARGYEVDERFYRHLGGPVGSRRRFAGRLAQHVPGMLGYRRAAREADVVHFQWLTVQPLDVRLLPRSRPLVITAHDVLPHEPRPGQLRAQRRLYERADAVVVHSHHGRERLVVDLGIDAARVHVIRHGAFTYLTELEEEPLPPELAAVEGPVVLFFGLLRPYKGLDVLLDAWRGIGGAELWIAGMPRMPLRDLRSRLTPSVRLFPGFVPEAQVPAWFRRADLVVLPYREAEQSGVLFTALAFGKPLLLTGVGGFPEVAEAGAAELVVPGDASRTAHRAQAADRRPRPPRVPGRGRAPGGGQHLLVGRDRRPPPRALRVASPRESPAVTALEIAFWACAALLVYAQLGYGLLLGLLGRVRRGWSAPAAVDDLPGVSLIVAAYQEAEVIAAKVANLRALDYPRDRLEVIVSCDGSTDGTPDLAREAGADLVLDNERAGKVRTQDAAVRRARSDLVAFSDANSTWEPDALRALVAPFADSRVGYVCGQVRFVDAGGTNQEGVYWRYEMWLRGLESRLASVTAGNGAIYATRRDSYFEVDPIMGHDLSFPFNMVKRGWRAVYAPRARATEKMVPSIEGEFARKRRMMSHTWPIVLRGGMLSPRGYGPLYTLMMASHRVLRYVTPFLHAAALALNIALVAAGAGALYWVTLALQAALVLAALAAGAVPARPLLIARYYVLTTASLAAGLWDWARHGTPAGWEPAEGTR